MTASVPTPDLSSYGLTKSADGTGYDFDTSGLVETHMPGFVNALENAAAEVTGAGAAIVGGIDAAAGVAAYVAPEVAADLTAASAEATALGISSLTGPLAPVMIALVVVVALVENNLASGGTGCCGTRPYSRAEAIDELQKAHTAAQGIFGANPAGLTLVHLGAKPAPYTPTEAEITNLLLYSGVGATAAPCDPKEYTWDASWASSGMNVNRPAGSPEAFVEGVMRAVWQARAGCWTDWDKLKAGLPGVMSAATRAWNNCHQGTSKRTMVLSPVVDQFLTNPIYIAARELRSMSKEPSAVIRVTFNTGAFISKPKTTPSKGKFMSGYFALPGLGAALAKIAPAPSVAGIAPLKMKLGITPAPPAHIEAGAVSPKPAAPGATILGLPAKDVGIGAVVLGAAGLAWKFLLK